MISSYQVNVSVSKPRKILAKIVAVVLACLSIVTFCFTGANSAQNRDASADLVLYLLCSFDAITGHGNVPFFKLMYEAATTDDLPRNIFYKSQVNGDAQTVGSLENYITTKDFRTPQLDILNNANKTSKKYTPFDRFGFSGMNFTNYNGEWNWYKIYFCRANGQGFGDIRKPEDGHLNDYYKDRDRPMDTWGSRGSSRDPRVKQRANIALYGNNFGIIISNSLFTIAKMVVALGTSMLEFSLTDVANKMGMVKLLANKDGVYINLFNNLFMNVISMLLILTAFWMLIKGVVKGHIREAFVGLARSILCIALGVFMMVNPAFWINLPNFIGLFGQNLLLQGISQVDGIKSGDVCTTEPGDTNFKPAYVPPTGDTLADTSAISKEFQRASDAIIRNVECEYWRIFALTPYSLAEYGTNYKTLWAKGFAKGEGAKSIDEAIPDGAGGEWKWRADYAGDAAVPLGNGEFIHNWVIYQISTQSSNHIASNTIDMKNHDEMKPPESPYSAPGDYSGDLTLVDGANTDWWRTADAFANYKSNTNKHNTNDSASQASATHAVSRLDVKFVPVKYWNNWIGADNAHRMLVSVLAICFSIVGLIGPIAIGLCIVAYALISCLMMALTPVFLTFGMWAGKKGTSIIKGFIQTLANIVLKRIAYGLMFLLLSVFMIKIAATMTDTLSYFKSMVLICVTSFVFFKNRGKLAQLIGRINIPGANMSIEQGAFAGMNSVRSAARMTGKFASNTMMGGIAGMAAGLGKGTPGNPIKQGLAGFTRGAWRGATTTAKNQAYAKSKFYRNYVNSRNSYNNKSNGSSRRTIICDNCGHVLTKAGQTKADPYRTTSDGSTLCMTCVNLVKSGKLPQYTL